MIELYFAPAVALMLNNPLVDLIRVAAALTPLEKSNDTVPKVKGSGREMPLGVNRTTSAVADAFPFANNKLIVSPR